MRPRIRLHCRQRYPDHFPGTLQWWAEATIEQEYRGATHIVAVQSAWWNSSDHALEHLGRLIRAHD